MKSFESEEETRPNFEIQLDSRQATLLIEVLIITSAQIFFPFLDMGT